MPSLPDWRRQYPPHPITIVIIVIGILYLVSPTIIDAILLIAIFVVIYILVTIPIFLILEDQYDYHWLLSVLMLGALILEVGMFILPTSARRAIYGILPVYTVVSCVGLILYFTFKMHILGIAGAILATLATGSLTYIYMKNVLLSATLMMVILIIAIVVGAVSYLIKRQLIFSCT